MLDDRPGSAARAARRDELRLRELDRRATTDRAGQADDWAPGAGYHGWKLANASIGAGGVGATPYAFTSQLVGDGGVQGGIAEIADGGLYLRRAGYWNLLFYAYSTLGSTGFSMIQMQWLGGAWARTYNERISRVGRTYFFAGDGDLAQDVGWHGYVTAVQADLPITVAVLQRNNAGAAGTYQFFLTAEFLGAA